MHRLVCLFLALGVLGACGATFGGNPALPLEQQQAVAFRHDGPPEIALITMVNNETGAGGHSALMVSGSQRVVFDPAGSFRPDWITEFGDVLYGMTPQFYRAYKSAHARETFHVVTQTVRVSPEVAEQALQLVRTNGDVPSAFCANSTSKILRQLGGFSDTRVTFYPIPLMNQFAGKSGVVTDKYFETDTGDVGDGIIVVNN